MQKCFPIFGYSYSLAILILPRGAHKSNMILEKSRNFIKICMMLLLKKRYSPQGAYRFLQMNYSGNSMARAWLV